VRRARVLVVDDEPSTVDVARAHLEADLAEVVAAADGAAAIALARAAARRGAAVRRRAARLPPAARERARGRGAAGRGGRRRAGGDHERPRPGAGGGRGDADGRVRLHRQAAVAGRSARAGRAGVPRSRRRRRRPAATAAQERRHHRRRAVADPALRAAGHGGGHRRDRHDPGRERHRQGAGGADDPQPVAALRAAVRGGELRGAARGAARGRAVRPRPRRVHRRQPRSRRPLGRGRRRDAVPRRGRRAAAGHPGQAPARPAVPRVPVGWATIAIARSTSGSSPPPTATWARWWRPGGSART
jgi:hypothetical protein